jgi:hypothetical protein
MNHFRYSKVNTASIDILVSLGLPSLMLRHGVPHRQRGHPVGVEPYDVHVGVKTPMKPKNDALCVHVFDVE